MSWALDLIPGSRLIRAALEFAGSKPGLVAIALLIGLWSGYRWADTSAEVRALEAQIAVLKIDNEIARHAKARAESQAIEIGIAARSNKEKVSAIEADLKARAKAGEGSCTLSAADARRLRDIR